jgi:hypothetical protein
MEGCHWPFRKAATEQWPKVMEMLLTGKFVSAAAACGWLIDYAGSTDDAVKTTWKIATGGDHGLKLRELNETAMSGLPLDMNLPTAGSPATEKTRKAISECVVKSCGASRADALEIQAKHSAGFMSGRECRRGVIGSEAAKVMNI